MQYAAQMGLIILVGLLAGRLARRVNLPEVSGYLVAGFVLGPSLLGLVDGPAIAGMHFIEELALAFIAFTIGLELNITAIRRTGKGILAITLLQSIATVALVASTVFLASRSVPMSLLLGAMATATSPGEVLLIIKGVRASGPVTRTCLGVVALDDGIGIILFSLVVPIAIVFSGGTLDLVELISIPVREVLGALFVGGGLGYFLSRILKAAPSHGFALAASLAVVLLATGIAHTWHTSLLLTTLTLGIASVNLHPYVAELLHDLDEVMAPVHVVFFGGIGASLSIAVLSALTPLTLVYTLSRGLGKYLGSKWGAKYTEAPGEIARYLWPTLLPQTGISVGLIAMVGVHFPELREAAGAIMLASSAIYAVAGFPLAQAALARAGETGHAPD